MPTKQRLAMVCAMMVFCGLSALPLRAQVESNPRPTTRPHASLHTEMQSMNRDYRLIRRQVGDSTKNESTLAAVLDLELHTLTAKSITPDVATTMPSAPDNAQKATAYQIEMINLLKTELDLEQTLRDGQNDKATEIANSLHALEDQGHKDFRPHKD